MKRKSRAAALLLAVFMAVACGGCALAGAEGLYALPELTDENVQLEELIAQRIDDGGEYAAPQNGRNRQTVQMRDLDGDGASEAIAFLADSGHTPTVCVYRQDEEGAYYLFVAIEGVGAAVSSVEYADLTGDGASELILAWQIGGDMRLLSVYALRQEEQTQLLSADCQEFVVADLDGDGVSELLDLTAEDGGQVTRYDLTGGEAEPSRAPLSEGSGEVLRLRAGLLSDGAAALFVESRWGEDELITDVFTAPGGRLTNITLGASGRSGTLRQGEAFAADVNDDRALELPESAGDVLNWYSLDSAGRKELALTTCHDYEDGWYLVLPEALPAAGLDVTRADDVPGETAVAFSVPGGSAPLLTVYTLTGENRLDRAREEGRFLLGQDGATVYAAALPEDGALIPEDITQNFHLIYQDWQSRVL